MNFEYLTCQDCIDFLDEGRRWKAGIRVRTFLLKETLDTYLKILKKKSKVAFFQGEYVIDRDTPREINNCYCNGHLLCDLRTENTVLGSTVCSLADASQPYGCRCDMRILYRWGCMCGGN